MRKGHISLALVVVLLAAATASPVEPGKPSRTSVWTALLRAIGAKNPDAQFRNPDHVAARFVGPRERALLEDYPVDALDLPFDEAIKRLPDPVNVMGMFIRTMHVDETLDQELRAGVRQVVILGAGFDSRGYRFQDRLAGVAFFEVDYGPTQEYKKQRVREVFGALPAHVRYVPMDFTKDKLLTQLQKQGYSERARTLFIWEGVTRYIPETAVKDTLHFVRDHAAAGSTMTFDYITVHNNMLGDPQSRPARWGEPFLFGFPDNGATDYVEREGLDVVIDYRGNELVRKYAMRSDGTSSLPLPPNASAGGGRTLGGHCVARVRAK